jgi:hypothetical protein
MRMMFACLVVVLAVTGCGSKEAGWQDEWREQLRRDVNNPELMDPAEMLQICAVFDMDDGRDLLEEELLAEIANDDDDDEYAGSGRPLDEILADYGLERNVKTLDEAVQIALDEFERPCP